MQENALILRKFVLKNLRIKRHGVFNLLSNGSEKKKKDLKGRENDKPNKQWMNLGKEGTKIPCIQFLLISTGFEVYQSKRLDIKMFTELVSGSSRKI